MVQNKKKHKKNHDQNVERIKKKQSLKKSGNETS